MIKSFTSSFKVLQKDKWTLALGMIPVLLGSIVYYFLGLWLYGDVLAMGKEWVENSLSSGGWGTVAYYMMMILLTVVMYFLISWTFVLVVSIIASPFNDLLSSRVEKVLLNEVPESISESFANTFKKIFITLLNETKKIAVIAIISLASFSLSFFPLLVPISVILSGLLLSANFLDYSWSRHDIALKGCLNGIRKSLLIYTVSGVVFLTLLSIPLVNIFCLPLAVIYFTVLFIENKHSSLEREK